jgi:hypothetical protein
MSLHREVLKQTLRINCAKYVELKHTSKLPTAPCIKKP